MTRSADGSKMKMTMDEAFEKWRIKRFGAHPYPIDAYTYFGVGWKAGAAEAERWRAALQSIVNQGSRDAIIVKIARRALEPKP
jgi:hypothetical protein